MMRRLSGSRCGAAWSVRFNRPAESDVVGGAVTSKRTVVSACLKTTLSGASVWTGLVEKRTSTMCVRTRDGLCNGYVNLGPNLTEVGKRLPILARCFPPSSNSTISSLLANFRAKVAANFGRTLSNSGQARRPESMLTNIGQIRQKVDRTRPICCRSGATSGQLRAMQRRRQIGMITSRRNPPDPLTRRQAHPEAAVRAIQQRSVPRRQASGAQSEVLAQLREPRRPTPKQPTGRPPAPRGGPSAARAAPYARPQGPPPQRPAPRPDHPDQQKAEQV